MSKPVPNAKNILKDYMESRKPTAYYPEGDTFNMPNYSGVKNHAETVAKIQSMIDASTTHTTTQPVRALETIYQNLTGRTLLVYGSIKGEQSKAGFWTAYVECKTDSVSTPTTVVQKVGAALSASEEIYVSFSFVVQPNHYYQLDGTVSTGVLTLEYWNETLL